MPGPMPNPARPFSRAHRGVRNLVILPAAGCTLPVPAIPEGRDWTPAETEMWRGLWQSPQATQWDESFTGSVAMYCANAAAVLAGECRSLAGR